VPTHELLSLKNGLQLPIQIPFRSASAIKLLVFVHFFFQCVQILWRIACHIAEPKTTATAATAQELHLWAVGRLFGADDGAEMFWLVIVKLILKLMTIDMMTVKDGQETLCEPFKGNDNIKSLKQNLQHVHMKKKEQNALPKNEFGIIWLWLYCYLK